MKWDTNNMVVLAESGHFNGHFDIPWTHCPCSTKYKNHDRCRNWMKKNIFIWTIYNTPTPHPEPPWTIYKKYFTYIYIFTLSIYQSVFDVDIGSIYIYIYPANMLPYTGAGRSLDDTVTGLLGDLAHKGYHLYMDNFYNSVSRCQVLRSLGTQVCGTMRRQQLRSSSRTMMRRLAVDCL